MRMRYVCNVIAGEGHWRLANSVCALGKDFYSVCIQIFIS
jgi:hypothetical protein